MNQWQGKWERNSFQGFSGIVNHTGLLSTVSVLRYLIEAFVGFGVKYIIQVFLPRYQC